RFLLALRRRVVAGRLRLELEDLEERLDDLVLDVVDDVAADAGRSLRGVDEHVHRALGVAAGALAANAGDDLLGTRELEIEQTERTGSVQAVDQVIDVLRRVLLAPQAGGGELEVAPAA